MKKTTRLKKMLESSELAFLMEAHNGLSAKIVEETGFQGIWGSGLAVSAAMGVRDNNEASWTQVLEVLEFMSDVTSIPILLDGDTGYGNFNNMRRLVRKLEQRGIAGVCIEDKLFPKTNSFISGETQPLAGVEEFCGKIKAAKDSQADEDFVVVARTEAFIAGWGLDEALRRAEAYRVAGADAILVHSKKTDVSDVESFTAEWGRRHPVVIVPTKYYSTPTEKFRDLGISLVIWANHNVRAAAAAMQRVTQRIFFDQSLHNVEDEIAPVGEIFRLQGADELKEAEKKYLPVGEKQVQAVILAASRGEELKELTSEIPKTLLKVKGKAILDLQIEAFNRMGIKRITVVRGFAGEKIPAGRIEVIDNKRYAETKELFSLYLAVRRLRENGNILFSYGDIVFKNYILNELLSDENDVTLLVDAGYEPGTNNGYHDYVRTDIPWSRKLFDRPVRLERMSNKLREEEITGEFTGLWMVNERGLAVVRETLERMAGENAFEQMRMSDLFNGITGVSPVAVKFIKGSWLDIDTIVDLQKAGEL